MKRPPLRTFLTRTFCLLLGTTSSALAVSANNDYANATVLNGNAFVSTVDVTGNNKQAGESNHGGAAGGRSAWWAWTPTITGVYQIDTAGSTVADTLLDVFTTTAGIPTTAALLIQNNDLDATVKSSSCRIRAVAGTTYKIALDTVSAVQGLVTLNIAPASGVPANDDIASAEPLSGIGPISYTASNVGSSVSATDPILHYERGHQPTSWFSYTPANNRIARFTVAVAAGSTIVPELGVYNSGGTRLGGPFPVSMTAGNTYFIAVAGNSLLLSGQQGSFVISVATEPLVTSIIFSGGQTWEWLHPLTSVDPTTDPNWAANWRTPGNASTSPAWNAAAPAPLAYGGIDLLPGTATNIGTPSTTANQNAAYFRRSFTTTSTITRLSAEILADDGAYIYIDNLAGVPVNMGAVADAFLTTACAAANATNTEALTKTVDLTSVIGAGLAPGVHTIAVSLHQLGSSSSDGGFDLQLRETTVSYGTALAVLGSINTGFQEPITGAKTFTRSGAQKEMNWTIALDGTDDPLANGAVPRGSVHQESDIVNSTTPADSARFQIAGSTNKFLLTRSMRFTTGTPGGFFSETMDINGLAAYSISCKLRAFTTSSTGFEVDDNLHVFLDTSSDGTTFNNTVEILPNTIGGDLGGTDPILNAIGPAALNTPYLAWTTRKVSITGNTAKSARFRMVGGTNTNSENLYLDDVQFSLPNPRILLTTPVVVRNNHNNDNPADDDFTITAQITSEELEPSTTWATSSVGAPSPTSGTYGATNVNFGPFPVTGGAKSILIHDSGNPSVAASLIGSPPVATITVVGTNPTYNDHGTPAVTSDDTVDVTITVTGTNASTGWIIPAAPANTGTFGTPQLVSVPITAEPALVVVADRAETTKTATLSYYFLTLGTVIVNAVPTNLITTYVPTGTAVLWHNTALGEIMHDGATVTNFTSYEVPLPSSGSTVTFAATLFANETSNGSNFESADNFKIELILKATDNTETTINLVSQNTNLRPSDNTSYDRNGDGIYAGWGDNTAANPYIAVNDEFNGTNDASSASVSETIPIGYSFSSAGIASARIVVTGGCNGSTSEHFTLKTLSLSYTISGDDDHDNLPDDWELNYFGSIMTQNGTDDSDHDGNSNCTEYLAGLDPTNPVEAIRITSLSKAGNNLTVTWSSLPGKRYQLRYSPNLLGPWMIMTTTPAIVPGAPGVGSTTATAPIPGAAGAKGFVEVLILP